MLFARQDDRTVVRMPLCLPNGPLVISEQTNGWCLWVGKHWWHLALFMFLAFCCIVLAPKATVWINIASEIGEKSGRVHLGGFVHISWGLHKTNELQPSVFVKKTKNHCVFPSFENELRLGLGRRVEEESEQTNPGGIWTLHPLHPVWQWGQNAWAKAWHLLP